MHRRPALSRASLRREAAAGGWGRGLGLCPCPLSSGTTAFVAQGLPRCAVALLPEQLRREVGVPAGFPGPGKQNLAGPGMGRSWKGVTTGTRGPWVTRGGKTERGS